MPVSTGQKSVTKTALMTFVLENSTLNLTQSKVLADHLLTEYNVTAKPPVDLGSVPVEVGQLWQYIGTPLVVRITDVELEPQYVPNNPVTIWSPENISWQNTTAHHRASRTSRTWLKCMRPVKTGAQMPPAQDDSTESNDPS
jgi:hypothetical protein